MIWKSLLFLTIITLASAYNADLGLKLCRLTVASYCAPAKVKDWSCRPCNDSPIKLTNAMPFYNSTGDVLGMIGTSSNPAGICISVFIFSFGIQGDTTLGFEKLDGGY